MPVDLEEYSRRLAAIGSSDAVVPLRQATMHALVLLGISAAYFIAPLTRDPRIGRNITNIGLPWTWERQYRSRLYLIDPLPLIAVERLAPFYWPDDIADVKLDKQQQRFMQIAAQYGLARGVGVACFGPDGRSGFLGAALPDDEPPPDRAKLQRIQAIGQTSFQSYCRIVKRATEVPPLSNRELEVLHWIGRGKSNSVIAEILDISPSSVDVYVRRLFAKLDVTDRTTASVKAFAQGLLVSGDYEKFINETRARQDAEGEPLGENPDAS